MKAVFLLITQSIQNEFFFIEILQPSLSSHLATNL